MEPEELIWADISTNAEFALLYFGDAEGAEGDAWTGGYKVAGRPFSDFITCVILAEVANKASWLEHIYDSKRKLPYYDIKRTGAPLIVRPVELNYGETKVSVLSKIKQEGMFFVRSIDDFVAGDKVIGDTERADELIAMFD